MTLSLYLILIPMVLMIFLNIIMYKVIKLKLCLDNFQKRIDSIGKFRNVIFCEFCQEENCIIGTDDGCEMIRQYLKMKEQIK